MRPWSVAWSSAADLFWRRESPGDHFRTSVSDLLAERMIDELHLIDRRLANPPELTVLDVGAGNGELLRAIRACAPPDLLPRLRLMGLDLRPCPDADLEWIVARTPTASLPLGPVVGLVMAHEWLDEVPCDVVERDGDGHDRLVLVDDGGVEELGPSLTDVAACADLGVDSVAVVDWVARWWPLREVGDRAEVGVGRDRAWRWLTTLIADGTALASDYGHLVTQRLTDQRAGTLVGYRHGRVVHPVPDGRVNLTAHVAVDSCAAQVPGSTFHTQREMLSFVSTSPPVGATGPDRARHVARMSTLARLRNPAGPGAFYWLRWDRFA